MKLSTVWIMCAGLALGLLPAASAETFRITGQEVTGETQTVDGDGSVRVVTKAGLNGLLYHVEANERTVAHALATMSITVNDDQLLAAELTYTAFGRGGFTVTVQIDPCWFEYVNDREATAAEFGEDVMAKVEAAAPPGALEPCIKKWFEQRLALLAAKTAEPSIKHGITLVPPRR